MTAEKTGITADWIAADWGTSTLRVWAMSRDGAVFAEARSDDGMSRLAPDAFEPALLKIAGDWLGPGKTRVVVCGMAGAKQGWREAPYREVPCTPFGEGMLTFPGRDPRLDVAMIPGLSQIQPPDVMRGEETQIAGYLAEEPEFDGVLCLPGTHTKWVRVSAGEVVSFQTFMTGELFALMSQQSVLRHTVTTRGWDRDAFLAAVADAMGAPQTVAARLFELRAGALVAGLAVETARARLSGLLIGLELAGARPYWLGQDIVIIGDGTLAGHYAAALALQGAAARQTDVGQVTLIGIAAAHDWLLARG